MPATARKSATPHRRAPGVKISARRGPEPGNEYFSYCGTVDGAFLPLDRLVARFGDEGMAAVAKFDERERVTWEVAKAVPVPNDEGVWRLSFTGYPWSLTMTHVFGMRIGHFIWALTLPWKPSWQSTRAVPVHPYLCCRQFPIKQCKCDFVSQWCLSNEHLHHQR